VGGDEPPRRAEERPRALRPALTKAAPGAGAGERWRRPLVARVLPDLAGFDRELDYEVPPGLAEGIRVGSVVRVPLRGRQVRAWVTGLPAEPPSGLSLRPLTRALGWGPEPEVVALAAWAAWRWAGRRRSPLVSASSEKLVKALPRPALAAGRRSPAGKDDLGRWLLERSWRPGARLLRLPPAASATELVLAAAEQGPVLVVAPTNAKAQACHRALEERQVGAALLPSGWAQARAGARVVVGARGAAWGPCPGMKSVVVLDAHDEGLVQEQAPTWDAPTVAAERARRAGVPCFWVSPCPTLEMLFAAAGLALPSRTEERQGWAPLRAVDRRRHDPREGLFSAALVQLLRAERRRVVCILNRKGRALLLDCRACGELATCERCGAAVAMAGEGLSCRRCGASRPVVCRSCGSVTLRALKLGLSAVREQLQALSGRATGEVAAGGPGPLPEAPVLVGTTTLLYREEELRGSGQVGAVVFLDFDQELLAPRYRAGEEALGLLARASRLVGGRSAGGQVLVQTRLPAHPVVRAAVLADPGKLAAAERPVREQLRLPPFGALALISGPGAAELVAALSEGAGGGTVELSELGPGRWAARANTYEVLCDALARAKTPPRRTRVEVGPARF
jgi:primosomal protein N' (replication factor Y)